MKGTMKLIRRFLMMVVCIAPILFALNIALLVAFTSSARNTNGGWSAAGEVGNELSPGEDGGYRLSDAGKQILEEYGAWAILVEDGTGNVIWHSDNLPAEIPMHYSAAEISWYTRGYIMDYPTTAASRGNDLLFLGHPKTAYWKSMWNTFDYNIIAGVPRMAITFVAVNGAAIFLIYMVLSTRILRSVKPVVLGMEALPEKDVYVRENGFLSEVAAAVNRVNEKLRAQERALKKKENARAGWISGVSHDIRTPLTMVLGYAAELEEDTSLPSDIRKKAGAIRRQSIRMKNLVGNLNLASKLEYHMQPLKLENLNLTAVLRQAAVDFMNLDLDEKYPVCFHSSGEGAACMLQGDRELLQRAVYNVLSNSQIHNPDGCSIGIELLITGQKAHIRLTDDGTGVTEEQLNTLRNTPHYMMGDGSGVRQRHGLGLLIVHQIAAAHGGRVQIGHNRPKGFLVEIILPIAGGADAQ